MFFKKTKEAEVQEKLTTDIEAMNLPERLEQLKAMENKFDTFIQLIASHRDSLPKDLMRSIKRLAKDEYCEFDIDYFKKQAINFPSIEIVIDGERINPDEYGIFSVNPILRRLKCAKKSDIYAKTLVIKDDKRTYMEW